jgi:hypothetical protein
MNFLLYILEFKKSKFIKIGITTGLENRIRTISDAINKEIDFYNSYIVQATNNSDIRLLERSLLRITQEDFYEIKPNSKLPGKGEFRNKKTLQLILDFIENQKKYNMEYRLYKGIDICGVYDHKIPKAYYPPNKKGTTVSQELVGDILNYCKNQKIDFGKFINGILYSKAVELGIERKNQAKTSKDFYRVA